VVCFYVGSLFVAFCVGAVSNDSKDNKNKINYDFHINTDFATQHLPTGPIINNGVGDAAGGDTTTVQEPTFIST
jgi:hypothetical protein